MQSLVSYCEPAFTLISIHVELYKAINLSYNTECAGIVLTCKRIGHMRVAYVYNVYMYMYINYQFGDMF
jgi:hypothetical protein